MIDKFLKLLGLSRNKTKKYDIAVNHSPEMSIVPAHDVVMPENLELQKEIDTKVGYYIETEQYTFLKELLEAGYPLTAEQAKNAVNQLVKFTTSTEPSEFVFAYIESHHRAEFDKVFDKDLFSVISASMERFDVILKSKILEKLSESQMQNLVKWSKFYESFPRNPYQRFQDYYEKRFSTSHNQLLQKVKKQYKTTAYVDALPDTVRQKVQAIEQSIAELDVEFLSQESKLQVGQLLNKTLPQITQQYAFIDKKLLSYKNAQNQTVEAMLLEGLVAIETDVAGYSADIDRAKLKEIKITARHMTANRK